VSFDVQFVDEPTIDGSTTEPSSATEVTPENFTWLGGTISLKAEETESLNATENASEWARTPLTTFSTESALAESIDELDT
jgi:hypothetical protein